MEVVPFRESNIDTVFEIKGAAYKPLYDKYQDRDTSPYSESKETVLQKYTKQGTKGYLFIKNGVTVGTVRIKLSPDGKIAWVSGLAVLPQYQGQGIAQQALLTIEEIHKEVEKWCLITVLQEPKNCHLYEKLGYHRTGKTEIVNDKMTFVYYEKDKA